MRFLDEVISKRKLPVPPGMVVIKADEVARYMFEEMPEVLDATKDFPNVAPPFPAMAVESLLRGVSRDGRGGKVLAAVVPRRVVWLSQSVETKDSAIAEAAVRSYLSMLKRNESPLDGDETKFIAQIASRPPRWISSIVTFDELLFDREPLGTTATAMTMLCIGPDGSIQFDDHGRVMSVSSIHPAFQEAGILQEAMTFFYPFFLTLSFMHCKNVELKDIPNPPSFERRFVKWNGRPPIRYKELDILPMRKVLRSAAEAHHTGIHQAMHICRGHFKDYRQRGLFGKFKDIFWWDQMVRGSETQGVIHKTYNVVPDKNATSAVRV